MKTTFRPCISYDSGPMRRQIVQKFTFVVSICRNVDFWLCLGLHIFVNNRDILKIFSGSNKVKCSIRSWNFSLTASTVRSVSSYCINCFYALPYRYGQRGINGISRLPGSAFCVFAVHRCSRKLWYCRLERYGRKWRWERIPYFFAAAGDIQAKPTRVSGGLDLLVFFYSGAVRSLLIVRSQQAIYRIVRNRCGYKTTLSDFR